MILDDIEKLKQSLVGADEFDRDTMRAWEEQVKKAFILLDLKNHDGIKMIIERYEGELKTIDTVLLNDENLENEDRKLLFKKKQWAKSFLSLFSIAENTVKDIEKQVSDNLNVQQDS